MLDDVLQTPTFAASASPPATHGETMSDASQMQERLESHHSAEISGRIHPDLAPFAHQLQLKRQALCALLSKKFAPSTLLARLKSCNGSEVRYVKGLRL